jgi:hypothetical protein
MPNHSVVDPTAKDGETNTAFISVQYVPTTGE